MNEYLNLLLKTINDPNPGLLFGKHKQANVPKRVYRSEHVRGTPCSDEELSQLRHICGSASNGLDALIDLYALHNGMNLYKMPDREGSPASYAVKLYPFSHWEEQTAKWTDEDMAWAIDDCPLYRCGPWKVIGEFGSGSMNIVMFFGGEYEGIEQMGRCYCLGLDGLLDYEEILAENFEQLTVQLSGKLIVKTLRRIGFTGFIQTGIVDNLVMGYGDVVKKYIPNIANNRHLVK